MIRPPKPSNSGADSPLLPRASRQCLLPLSQLTNARMADRHTQLRQVLSGGQRRVAQLERTDVDRPSANIFRTVSGGGEAKNVKLTAIGKPPSPTEEPTGGGAVVWVVLCRPELSSLWTPTNLRFLPARGSYSPLPRWISNRAIKRCPLYPVLRR